MRGFYAFTKKEFLEQLRTYKWLIMLAVFFLFGMMSPLLAKLMPEIFAGMKIEGMEIVIPEPTVLDAYSQFFKNLTQMGILVLLLVFGGTLSNELMKGTLINILAKGLPRHTVILAKYFASVALWTTGYLLSVLTTYGYTEYLFEDTTVQNLGFSIFCLWLFGCFILALIFLSSTLTTGSFGGLILSGAAIVIMLLINIFPKAERFNPITLASKNVALLTGAQEFKDLMLTVGVTALLIVASLVASIVQFRKKRL
jgi:ABC-2 type transport system permease protein